MNERSFGSLQIKHKSPRPTHCNTSCAGKWSIVPGTLAKSSRESGVHYIANPQRGCIQEAYNAAILICRDSKHERRQSSLRTTVLKVGDEGGSKVVW